MHFYPRPVARLIDGLSKLPGIGPKTAQRLAFHLLNAPPDVALSLARALEEARTAIRYCSVCGNFTDDDPCFICRDERRRRDVLCVVERPRDVVAMEKTRAFNGLYHVLHGAISPMDGVGPEQLRIKELFRRLEGGEVLELILATNPNVEGDATALYLAGLLKSLNLKVTRIAHGLPVGADLEYADQITLSKSLEGRQEIK
ncbi:recombination mediator RecR [Pelotomaculum terephthalicicum JT]|uniref:recombination mediator RecR n=1 Tax=Pelotomaculum TaxID=191373 RepID=UPI0009CC4501|nr:MULTISPECIES: recombination mediator RecR [Pelotomaculum]MCG9968733.1 recombination mediator RecR [Pelotomaculum terephthalicicum JT]OPX86637.1 MAG: Recombination protein RecR [Pelotomaculum sp. PtaB.Bin117]OPY59553.1 MAG: Recombination protein RecR [Pelotomaculum sp. PtaU1.Bin065]